MNQFEPQEIMLRDGRRAIIRPAEKSDAEQILGLFHETVAHDLYNVTTTADLQKMDITLEKEEQYILDHQKSGYLLLAAQVDDAVAGTIAIENGERERTAHSATLHISVGRRYRQNGIAAALIKAALRWAQSDPLIEKVSLGVFSNHTVAINLYKKMGFIEEGRKIKEFKTAPGNYIDEILMNKWVK